LETDHARPSNEIAKRLHFTEGTIGSDVSAVFTGLDVNDCTRAAIFAWWPDRRLPAAL
jgi:DNA-binding NarL/FixJ family response regulator